MPLSNDDNPAAEPVAASAADPVAPADAPAEPAPAPKKAAKPKAEPEPAPVLAKAFTSGNAEVHNLVAEWEIASSNQDKDHLAAVEAKLAALGYQI
jgi:hypothetical protein